VTFFKKKENFNGQTYKKIRENYGLYKKKYSSSQKMFFSSPPFSIQEKNASTATPYTAAHANE